jgi:hypothetical protein
MFGIKQIFHDFGKLLNTKNENVSTIPDFYVDSVRSYTQKS